MIERCVHSLTLQSYPRDLYEIVVIADNCEDSTPITAKAAGARVLTRNVKHGGGKGGALQWGMDILLREKTAPDAIIVVDADSSTDFHFLSSMVFEFENGATTVQGKSLLEEDGSAATSLRAAAYLLIQPVRASGRAVLGLDGHLAGNGMLFSSDLLRRIPWKAYSSVEDAEYSLNLKIAGERIVFAGGAVIKSPAPPTAQAVKTQELRWDGGRAHLARAFLPRLIRRGVKTRSVEILATAFELAIPQMAILTAATLVGTLTSSALLALGLTPAWSLIPWIVSTALIPIYVLNGLAAGRAPLAAYKSLALAPFLVVRKTASIPRLLRFDGEEWVRTERDLQPGRD